jgi:branched-chain amino acid transport system permease protein
MLVIQYTSPETMSFGHSIELLAAMVIGGAASIVGSVLGGAFYVLVPQLTNQVDASLTALLQGAILLVVLFLLPGGLASLPRALARGRRRLGAERGHAASPTTPSSTPGSGTAAEEPETERQGHA